MKVLLVLFSLAAVVFADINNNEIDLVNEDGTLGVEPKFILSWEARQQIRKLQKQMPCGWPDHGIPPLAPYRREQMLFNLRTQILETINDVFHFQIAGLDDFKIKKLKLNLFTKRIKYHFIFKKISVSGRYNTDTFLNLIKEWGLSIRYEGDGNLDLSLENLSVSGNLKFKLPVLFGSAKITQFYMLVTLGDCNSNVSGLLGTGKMNRFINDKIEDVILSGINENTAAISAHIEAAFVPRANKMLKGNDFWDLMNMITSSGSGTEIVECIPPGDVWD